MEGIQERQASKNISSALEATVEWLGVRISSVCGIRISNDEKPKLTEILRKRMTVHSVQDPLLYFQLVESPSREGIAEWEQLLALFLNGETHFFRDSGQITLLKDQILPTLIHRRKAERSLRIWSAGCSTGEEAYSLAILVDQLLPDRQNWEIFILGTDINRRSIQHAQHGIYGQWAFRKVDLDLQQRYFQQRGSQWILNEPIRKMVTFRNSNIFADTFSSSNLGIYDLDLIICRNVFLYFHTDAIGHVVKKMSETLTSKGYFLTGHGELPAKTLGWLQAKNFPDSVIYQRPQTMCAIS
jgi:chemotaxis protein methyltransferase CheR